MDLKSLIDEFNGMGLAQQIASDPRIQFGTPSRTYLGAQLLPNQLTDTNSIVEDLIRMDVVIADDGDPFSPPQMKATSAAKELMIRLGHIDLAAQMTPKDMKTLGKIINRNDRAAGMEFLSRWLVTAIRLGIEEKAELQRWQAMTTGQVQIKKMDGNTSTGDLKFPADHTVEVSSGSEAAPAGWYSDTFDPIAETLIPAKQKLADKGYTVNRIITSSRIRDGVLASNEQVLKRTGGLIVTTANGVAYRNSIGAATVSGLNAQLLANELPPVEVYDLRYRTQKDSKRFLDETKVVMFATTGRDQTLDLGDAGLQAIENTFGYYGVGVSAGQTDPGMVIATRYRDLKPVGIYAEGYQEGFPVVLDGEAIFTITIPPKTA